MSIKRHRHQPLQPLLLTVALLATVLMAVLPHHHHGRLSCFEVEMCEQDQQANDRHTAHHQDGDDADCAVQQLHQGYLKAQQVSLQHAPTVHHHHHAPAALGGQCARCQAWMQPCRRTDVARRCPVSPSPTLTLHLLRAPPCRG